MTIVIAIFIFFMWCDISNKLSNVITELRELNRK